jgi:hypothetical protein
MVTMLIVLGLLAFVAVHFGLEQRRLRKEAQQHR